MPNHVTNKLTVRKGTQKILPALYSATIEYNSIDEKLYDILRNFSFKKILSEPKATIDFGKSANITDWRWDNWGTRTDAYVVDDPADEWQNKDETINLINSFGQFETAWSPPLKVVRKLAYLICKEISNSCKVAIGGDGGDELFGGYSHYNRFIQLQKLSKFIPYFFRKSLSQSLTKNINLAFKGKKSLEILGSNFNELNIDDANLFSYEMRKLLFSDTDSRKITQEFKYIEDRDFVTNLCFKDYKNYLCEDILVKLDRASMASGLELRSPFLDSEIINFAFNKVPSKFKLTTTKRKILPKALAKQVLPSNFDLSRKQGFSLPINKLFRTSDWKDYFYSNLIENNSRIFNGKYIESLFNSHQKGDNHGEKLFAILIFSLWYRKFITHSL